MRSLSSKSLLAPGGSTSSQTYTRFTAWEWQKPVYNVTIESFVDIQLPKPECYVGIAFFCISRYMYYIICMHKHRSIKITVDMARTLLSWICHPLWVFLSTACTLLIQIESKVSPPLRRPTRTYNAKYQMILWPLCPVQYSHCHIDRMLKLKSDTCPTQS